MNKIEIIGEQKCLKEGWVFQSENKQYTKDICETIDEIFGETKNGDRFKITIEKIG